MATDRSWPPGDGEMAQRTREFDWAATPLGQIGTWPAALRATVTVVLDSGFPAALVWGPELVTIYNDRFRSILGGKPEALGRSFAEIWSEAWPEIAPLVERALAGQTTFIEDYPLVINRSGQPEQAYFTFSYSPIRAADGSVAGMLDTVIETTQDVLGRERLRESEARYRALATASADVIYRMGPDWSEMRRLDGRGFIVDTERSSTTWLETYIDPADRPEVQAAVDEAVLARRPFELEHRVRRVDGTLGWIHSRAAPLLDERGAVVEWVGAARDVTERKRTEQQRAFVLTVSDALRPLASAEEVTTTACRLLVDHLDVNRAHYIKVEGEPGAEIGVVRGQYVRTGEPMTHRFPLARFGESVIAVLRRGETWVMTDTDTDPRLDDGQRDAFRSLDSPGAVCAPLVIKGRLTACFTVHSATPRGWQDTEVALVREVAQRTRMEAALRASEERYRALFATMEEGFCVIEKLPTAPGVPSDFRYVAANPAFTRHTGLGDPVGRTILELVPNAERAIMERYDRVAVTGELERFEAHVAELDLWMEAEVFPAQEPGQIAVLFSNVTERKRAELALRASEAALQERVAEATAELRALSRRLLTIQEEERRHLSRELHDEIGQALTALSFRLSTNQTPDGGRLAEARRMVQELTEQVRQLSMDLRPATLETHGLLPTLLGHLERFQQRTGVAVELRHEGVDRRFPGPVEITAYRVVQEALTNVARHAGAQRAVVQLLADGEAMTVVIRDDGRGFDLAAPFRSSGLGGMRERVELIGGELTIDTRPGDGTVVTADMPLTDGLVLTE